MWKVNAKRVYDDALASFNKHKRVLMCISPVHHMLCFFAVTISIAWTVKRFTDTWSDYDALTLLLALALCFQGLLLYYNPPLRMQRAQCVQMYMQKMQDLSEEDARKLYDELVSLHPVLHKSNDKIFSR